MLLGNTSEDEPPPAAHSGLGMESGAIGLSQIHEEPYLSDGLYIPSAVRYNRGVNDEFTGLSAGCWRGWSGSKSAQIQVSSWITQDL